MHSAVRALAFLVLASTFALGARAQGPAERVVYFPELDVPQGRESFERFRQAVIAEDLESLYRIRVEFLPVEVTDDKKLSATLAAAIAKRPAAIIGTSGTTAQAIKALTDDIPIIFANHADPVRVGLVASMAKPGANVTGFSYYLPMDARRLQILVEAFPSVRLVGVLGDRYWIDGEMNLSIPPARGLVVNGQRLNLKAFEVNKPEDLSRVLSEPAAMQVDAWYVPHHFFASRFSAETVEALRKTNKPVMYARTKMVQLGGLMSYQQDIKNPHAIWAGMLKMILNGMKAGDIPVERPKDFELALNLTAAKADGLRLPKPLLRRADITY